MLSPWGTCYPVGPLCPLLRGHGPAASWWQSLRLKAQFQAHDSHMEIYIIIHTHTYIIE